MKLIIAAVIGSIFELFDFVTFMLLLPILIKVFFPVHLQGNGGWWISYLIITISYFLRPVGGIILGHIGDKYGRKSVFSITLLMMSLPSLLLSLLPGYNSIGYLSIVFLILIRILQGFSVGGEVPGSITYVAEKFQNSRNYFFACAWLTFGANVAVAIANQSIRFINYHWSEQFMLSYGWRIPFLLSTFLLIIGVYIRKYISESTEYKKIKHKAHTIPLLELVSKYKSYLLSSILLAVTVSAITAIFHLFLPIAFAHYYNFKFIDLTKISSLGAITMAIGSLLSGYLTKYLSPLLIVIISLLSLIAVFSILSFNYFTIDILNDLYIVEFTVSLLLAGVNGIFFGLLADIFPVYIRYSGIALSYNIAYILGAGVAPLWAELILKFTQHYQFIMLVCGLICLLSLINTIYLSTVLRYNNISY